MKTIDELRPWLALQTLEGIGPRYFRRLLHAFGDPGSVLKATEGALIESGMVGRTMARKIAATSVENNKKVQEEVEEIQKWDVKVLTIKDEEYPKSLLEIGDPPCLLYIRGEIVSMDEFSVAIVGTRRISQHGKKLGREIASDLAKKGITIISGFANGADTEAHLGAIEAGGRTLAVLGNGLSTCYPKSNRDLVDEVVAHGAMISELPMKTGPLRQNFPLRNRLISGLSLGTLVVEAPKKSGALITARYVAEHGKHLFAVPGRPGDFGSEGPNALIREGAVLIQSAEDIIEELDHLMRRMEEEKGEEVLKREPAKSRSTAGESPEKVNKVKPDTKKTLGEIEKKIFDCLSGDPVHVDILCRTLALPPHELSRYLLQMELQGFVARLPGMRYITK